jgi:hypothetical protein
MASFYLHALWVLQRHLEGQRISYGKALNADGDISYVFSLAYSGPLRQEVQEGPADGVFIIFDGEIGRARSGEPWGALMAGRPQTS